MNDARRPAWREPMLWLAAALPAAVLVAAGVTIAIARGQPAGHDAQGVRRIAQIQLQDLQPDREAARLGLRAQLDGDATRGILVLRVSGGIAPQDALELALLHPTRDSGDRRVELTRDGEVWRGSTAPWPATQAWDLRVQDRDGRWRVGGRLAAGAAQAELQALVAR